MDRQLNIGYEYSERSSKSSVYMNMSLKIQYYRFWADYEIRN